MKRPIAVAAVAPGSVISICVLALVLFAPAIVQASAPRVTRGDAEAILQAQGGGGWMVRLNGGTLEGAPSDFLQDSLARISPAAAWNGRHFCSLDWHVINVAAIEGNAAGGTRTQLEIREFLSQIEIDINLDGAPLDTVRLAVKRFLNPELRGLVEAYSVTEGRVMAPEDLSVGQHWVQFTGHRPGQPPMVMPPITFFIDAPGVGICV
jgi:hypothetical protein